MTVTKSFMNEPQPKPQGIKKFYLLDYFLILLRSCESSDDKDKIFIKFKILKRKERLGESKYKKIYINDEDDLSTKQVNSYEYTFNQVISESANCDLVNTKNNLLALTKKGEKCLELAKKNKRLFYDELLKILEDQYFAFFHLIKLMFKQNVFKNGLLIFPKYPPPKLGFEKIQMTSFEKIKSYSFKLKEKLEEDIKKFLDKTINLSNFENKLLEELKNEFSLDEKSNFEEQNYRPLIDKFRKYWFSIFLKEIYQYPYSINTFNYWIERGKQLGVIYTTEFYPYFYGRMVYPTSIIAQKNENKDLKDAYSYNNGESLFIHKPSWNNIDNVFVDKLFNSYIDLKKRRKTSFIRVSDVREKVCYRLKIPSFVFNNLLENAYNENLKGSIKIKISLEADRLPHETGAMYLKREPVIINNEQKNIIAISYVEPIKKS